MDKNASVAFIRENSDFLSGGTRCAGWLYLPRDVRRPPVVVMAHGLALEKAFRLAAFAERFAQNGLAVFVFDYRNFGDSDGEPRNLVNPRRHLRDWKSAIAHVRSLPGIDHERIALWGTSFAGGHVLVTAAQETGISAVIAQVPFVDGLDFARAQGLKYAVLAVGSGLRDVVRTVIFGKRWKVPVVGDPGTFAVLTTPDSKTGYQTLVPQGSQWKNECPAAFLLTGPFYRPTRYAAKIECPALIVWAEKDTICASKAVRKAAAKMKDAQRHPLPIGHFDVYYGDAFEQAVSLQVEFLKRRFKA